MKKRIRAAAFCAAAAIFAAGCGSSTSTAAVNTKNTEGLSIVCVGFPEYDWTMNILGDTPAEVTYLLGSGVDMHSFQPTAAEIAKIAECDLFVYTGGESQEWADDALENSVNGGQQAVKLLDVLAEKGTVKEEEIKEGMEAEEEEDEGDEEGAPEYDEHVWLTPGNAEIFSAAICDSLKAADPAHAEDYEKNLESYDSALESLAADYSAGIAECSQRTMIVADRFPFRYLTDEYGIDYYAAFAGCSAETEASFETVAFLAGKADEVNAGTIFILENSDGRLAQSVIDSTENKTAKTAELNSMQSVTAEQIKQGATYTGIMQENLNTLKEALK